MEIVIKKIGINGEGIGYYENKPVFVMGGCVDETCEIEITKRHKSYFEAKLLKVKNKSRNRVRTLCPIQRQCGGCSLMIMDYKTQLQVKEDLLCESLKKYAGISKDLVSEIIPAEKEFYYRNQFKLPIKSLKYKLRTGMYQEKSNFLIPLDNCYVHEKDLELVRKQVEAILNKYELKDYYEKTMTGIRYLVIRGIQGSYQCTIVTGNDRLPEECIEELKNIKQITSLYQNINTSSKHEMFSTKWVHLGLNKSIMIDIMDLHLKLSSASFFQLNTEQAKALYSIVNDLIKPCKTFVEAYCGIGAMSLVLSDKYEKGFGIEVVSSAINNAKENARLNKISNVEFIVGDAADEMTKISKKMKVDCLLVDPPRSGLDDYMIDTILRSKPTQIIYVSCNPATLAKNLNDLQNQYIIENIIPVDMFPQTPHVECVVSLVKK